MDNTKRFLFANKVERKLLRLFKGKKFFVAFAIAGEKGELDTRRISNDFPKSDFPHVKKELDLFLKKAQQTKEVK